MPLRRLTLLPFLATLAFGAAPEARIDEKHRAFFKEYCVECHNADKQKGKLRLDDIALNLNTVQLADRWQKILNQVNSGEMPPDDSKQPPPVAKADFLEMLSGTLVTARKTIGDAHGQVTMRRLNRREYKNTLRDLLGVDMGVNELPADGGAGAFDTVGASLFMSSDQFEQYLALGRQAIDEHVIRFGQKAAPLKIHLEAESYSTPRIAKVYAERAERHKLYVAWTKAVDAAAALPENAKIIATIEEEKKGDATYRYYQWQRIPGAPHPNHFGFIDVQHADQHGRSDWVLNAPQQRAYLAHPATKTGAFLTYADASGNPYQPFDIPGGWPAGKYTIRVRIAATADTPKSRHFVEFGPGGGAVVSTHQVTGTMDKPQVLEIPVTITTGGSRNFILRERGSFDSNERANQIFFEAYRRNGIGPEFALWIDWIEIVNDESVPMKTPELKVRFEAETYANPRITKSYADRVDCHERYDAWTKAVDEAAARPENAAIVATIAAEKKGNVTYRYYQWQRIPGAPNPEKFGYIDAIHADEQGRRNWVHSAPQQRAYLANPATKTGAFLTYADVFANPYQPFSIPSGWPAGKYTVRVRIAATADTPKSRHFVEFGPLQGAVASTHEVTGTMEAPQLLDIPVEITTGGSRGFFLRERGSFDSNERALQIFGEALKRNGIGPEFALWIDWIEIVNGGPTAVTFDHRETEILANQVVGGTYKDYYLGGYTVAKAYLDSDRSKPPTAFGKGIPDEQEAKFRVQVYNEHGPSFRRYLEDPLNKTGATLNIYDTHKEEVIALPPDTSSDRDKTKRDPVPPGEYMLRLRVGAIAGSAHTRHFLEMGSRTKDVPFAFIQTFQITGTTDAPQTIEVPVSITATGPRSFVFREKRDIKNDFEDYQAARKATGVGPPAALWVDWVEWEAVDSRRNGMVKVESAIPPPPEGVSEKDYAQTVITRFATRAFRGKIPDAGYVNKLVALFAVRRKAGDSLEVALKQPLSVVMASPGFLYLQEPSDEKQRRRLSDIELAARLSYFIWSAPPDAELLRLAEQNTLHEPAILGDQVDRLIADPKSSAFVTGFTHQWLGLHRLDFFQFDTKLHKDFDDSTKAAARHEVYQTIDHILRQGDSLRRLLKSDYVVINGLLADYYGLSDVRGDAFRKVPLPKDSPRGGLLGMAATLAMGSNGRDSSPVERGAWILRKILHEPPPPAPPNVPQLNRLEDKILSTRERLAAHQEQPQCAQCHRKIDPIGFGLENFNATGKWRTTETYEKKGVGSKTWPISPSGAFYKGASFKDYFELRDLIAAQPEKFARGFTEALIEYGMGRPFGFLDDPLAADILKQAQSQDYQMATFLRTLVLSETFQTK